MVMQRQPGEQTTFEEAATLDPDKHPGELERGRWIPMTRGTWRHGIVAGNVYAVLRVYAKAHGGFSVAINDPGTKVRRAPDGLRGPDVGVIRTERVPNGKGVNGWLEGAPDLAVEVIGDSQTHSDLAEKALEYLAAGGKLVWVVDPDRERVVVYTPPDHVRVVARGESLDGGDALPGFSCSITEFFD
jgi:Uma2 family endonuclease